MSSLGAWKNLYGDLILPPRTHTWQSPTHHMIGWACVLFAEFCNEKAFTSSQLFLPKSKHRHSQELLDAWPQFILLQLKPVLSCSSTGHKVPSFSPLNLCHLQGHPSPGPQDACLFAHWRYLLPPLGHLPITGPPTMASSSPPLAAGLGCAQELHSKIT